MLRYLDVTLDPRRSFTAYIREASARAMNVAVAVARIIPNIGGPGAVKKRLLVSVAQSRLLNAALVWAQLRPNLT